MFGVDDAAIALLLAGIASSAGSIYNTNRQLAQAGNINDSAINLANTAHQREVLDLKAAGINPVLTASGSGASVPSLKAADTENPLSGIADGISSASKYASQEYKAQLDQIRLGNHQTEIVNSALADEKAAAAQEADNRLQLANLERDGIEEFLGTKTRWNGREFVTTHDRKQYKKAVDLAREAVQSDVKLRANANWRANLSSFVPFTAPTAVNSAASAGNKILKFLK